MKVVFAGTPEFAAQAMRAIDGAGHQIVLALTQPDRRAGRGHAGNPVQPHDEVLQFGDRGHPYQDEEGLRPSEEVTGLDLRELGHRRDDIVDLEVIEERHSPRAHQRVDGRRDPRHVVEVDRSRAQLRGIEVIADDAVLPVRQRHAMQLPLVTFNRFHVAITG